MALDLMKEKGVPLASPKKSTERLGLAERLFDSTMLAAGTEPAQEQARSWHIMSIRMPGEELRHRHLLPPGHWFLLHLSTSYIL
jgi:hypothetical protein